VLLGVCDPLPPLPVVVVVVLPVDRVGSLGVGVGAGLLRTGTVDLVGGALVVGLVGGRVLVLVETPGLFAGVVFLTTLAFALGLGFAGGRGGVFAFAGAGLAAGLCAAAGAAGVGVD
jgi:hypothetical protein